MEEILIKLNEKENKIETFIYSEGKLLRKTSIPFSAWGYIPQTSVLLVCGANCMEVLEGCTPTPEEVEEAMELPF